MRINSSGPTCQPLLLNHMFHTLPELLTGLLKKIERLTNVLFPYKGEGWFWGTSSCKQEHNLLVIVGDIMADICWFIRVFTVNLSFEKTPKNSVKHPDWYNT